MPTKEDVARVAESVVQARIHGHSTYQVGQVTFALDETGMCARFVREVHEAALGQAEHTWVYQAGTALGMEAKLGDAGLAVAEPQRGDVICFNRNSGKNGHIGIYLGNGNFAENTSSGSRGEPRTPGTKISTLTPALRARVTGYYAPMASAVAAAPKVVLLPANEVIACAAKLEGEVVRCELRALAEALGYEVTDHLADQGKVYLQQQPLPLAP